MRTRTNEDIGFKCGAQWALTQSPEQLLLISKKRLIVIRMDHIERIPAFVELVQRSMPDDQMFWAGFLGGVRFLAKLEQMKSRRMKKSRRIFDN